MTPARPPLAHLLRRFGQVLFSSVLSLGVLVLVNLLLPRATSPEVFGAWRKVVLGMVAVGVVHLGMADALFKVWARGAAGPLGVRNLSGYLAVIAAVSVLYTGLVGLVGLVPGGALLPFLVFAVLSAVQTILLAKLLAEQTGPLLVLRLSAQPVLLLLLLVLVLIHGQPTVLGLLWVYVVATLLAALVLVPGAVTARRQPLPSAGQLVLDLGGLKILLSNLLFLALINVDKLVLSVSVPLADFANYNLMSTVVLASSTVFSQVGNAIYAQGVLDHAKAKGVLLGGIALAFAALWLGWGLLERPLAAFFPQYDLRLFVDFVPAAALMSAVAVYYLPRLKYAHPQKVSGIILSVIATYIAAFLALRTVGEIPLRASILAYTLALALFAVLSEVVARRVGEVRKVQHES